MTNSPTGTIMRGRSIGFDKILGMGGQKAAVAYSDPKLIPDGNGFDFQLTADQAAQFKQFKDTATN